MQVDAALLQIADRQLQFGAVRAQEGQRDVRGLLHHIAQLAGELEAGRAGLRVGERGFHVQHVATRAGDREAGDHARYGRAPLGRVLRRLRGVVRAPDQRAQFVHAHRERQVALAQFALGRDLPQQPPDGPLQVPYARLAGVLAGQLVQRLVRERDLAGLQSGPLQLARQQVVPGDDDLLVLGVAVQPDQLHAVEQRLRDGLQDVGGGQEDHVAQVQLDLQVVVPEGVVLGRVEDFEEGGGRVAPEVRADLVDLVEQDDRVHRTGLLDGADDAAGQRSDVRTPVAADLRLVPYAAERDPDELAAHGTGHGLAQRGLADAGRPDQRQHGAAAAPADQPQAAVRAPLAHGQVLGDAFLDVLQTGVVGVQDLLGAGDVVRVLRALVPRQLQHRVQPGPDPAALGALVAGPLQLVDLLEGRLADVLGQLGGLDAGAVVLALVLRVAVQLGQFLADGLHLAAQQELALLLVDALLDVLGDGLRHVLFGEVVAQRFGGLLQPRHRVGGLQQEHLLLGAQERRVAGVVRELRDVLDLLDAVHDLPGAALLEPVGGQRLVLLDQLGDRAGQGVGHRLVDGGALHPQRGPGTGGARADPHPAETADERAGVAVGQPPDLFDAAQHADARVGAVDARHKKHPRLVTR